jgi:hypothetical protein
VAPEYRLKLEMMLANSASFRRQCVRIANEPFLMVHLRHLPGRLGRHVASYDLQNVGEPRRNRTGSWLKTCSLICALDYSPTSSPSIDQSNELACDPLLRSLTYATPASSLQAAVAASFRHRTARLSWLSSPLQTASGESGSSMSGTSPRPSRFVPCHVKYAATGRTTR